MKIKWIPFLTISMLFTSTLLVIWLFFFSNPKGTFDEIHYHMPKGFTGCAYIIYNVEGARALEVNEKRQLHHYFNEEGISLTSSPQQFGWASVDSSGAYMPYYYVGGQLISMDQMTEISSAVGSAEFHKGGYVDYESHALDAKQDCGGLVQNEMFEKYWDRLLTK